MRSCKETVKNTCCQEGKQDLFIIWSNEAGIAGHCCSPIHQEGPCWSDSLNTSSGKSLILIPVRKSENSRKTAVHALRMCKVSTSWSIFFSSGNSQEQHSIETEMVTAYHSNWAEVEMQRGHYISRLMHMPRQTFWGATELPRPSAVGTPESGSPQGSGDKEGMSWVQVCPKYIQPYKTVQLFFSLKGMCS